MNTLETLRAEREELLAEIEGLTNADNFDPKDDTFTQARSRAEALDGKIRALVEWQASRQAADSIDALAVRGRQVRDEVRSTESAGQTFVRSRAYQDYSWTGASGRVDVDFGATQHRAPLKTSGFPPVPQRFDVSEPRGGLPLSSLVTTVPVTSGSVDYVKYVFTNAAGVVPEATVKPESTLTRTVESKSIPTVAHFVEATRQLLEDETALESMIDDELRFGVDVKFEDLIGAAITSAVVPQVDDPDLLRGIRLAIGSLPKGYVANALLVNPLDWAELDLSVMVNAGTGPNGTAQFWGLAPVASEDVAQGTAYVGDFRQSVRFWRRTAAQVFITDSHGSNFTSNIITLLGEGRGLADVIRPNGLVYVTTAGGAPLAAGGNGGAKK